MAPPETEGKEVQKKKKGPIDMIIRGSGERPNDGDQVSSIGNSFLVLLVAYYLKTSSRFIPAACA